MKKTIILLFCLFFLINNSSVFAEELGAKGFRLFQQGLYEEALTAFNKAWMEHPEQRNYESYMEICKKLIRAENIFEKSKYKEALLLTEEVIILVPKDEKLKVLLVQRKKAVKLRGQIDDYYEQGDYKKILTNYEDLLDLNPQDIRTAQAIDAYRQYSYQLDKARQLFRKGEWEDSIAIYRKAWTLLPTDQKVQKAISLNVQVIVVQELFIIGQYKEAAVGYKRLFQENPEAGIFRKYMQKANQAARVSIETRVAFAEGNFEEAQEWGRVLIDLNPDDQEAQDTLDKADRIMTALAEGDQLLLEQYYEQAYKKYLAAFKEAPDIEILREKEFVGRKIIGQQKQKNPDFSEETLAKYETYEQLKNYVTILTQAEESTKKEITLVEKLIDLRNEGVNLFYNGDYSQAIEKFNEVRQINAKDKVAANFRYRAQRALKYREQIKDRFLKGEDAAAQKIYKQLIAINPEEKTYRQLIKEIGQ